MLKWTQELAQSATLPLRYDNFERQYYYEATFSNLAAAEGKVVYTETMNLQGCTDADLNLDALNLHGKLLKVAGEHLQKIPTLKIFGWDEGVVAFDSKCYENELLECFMQITTTNERTLKQILDHFVKWEHTPESTNQGHIYTLTRGHRGEITYASIGTAKVPFIESNYEDDIVKDIHYVIDSLCSDSPVGRIILLNGEPGTGKTYLIRSILSSVEKATFLLLAPELVGQITGPDLMSFLVNHTDMITPLVLIIEDADACLASRKLDNISLISNFLNISDGIIGNMIDIRIIATTNADNKDIDKAILRPGRLLKRINIGKLSPEQAMAVYKRLTGKDPKTTIEGSCTLAEVYYKAREADGIVEKTETTKTIGFSTNQNNRPATVSPPRGRF